MKTSKTLYNLRDKEKSLYDFYQQTLNKSLEMFSYNGLPVPANEFERQLQENGYTVVFKYQDKVYCNSGNLAGQEKSPYNEPTEALITIPALNLSKTFELDSEAVLIDNDFLRVGLKPLILSKGTQIVENRLTMYLKNILNRAPFTITANSDKLILSAQTFINKLENGDLAVIAEDSFLKDVSVDSLNQTNQADMQDLINYQTYLYGQLFNELGLPALNNEKKERMVSSEINSQQSVIRPLVDNMLECRKKGIEKMNKLFNGNTEVELDSIWQDVKNERKPQAAPVKTEENTNNQEDTEEPAPKNTNENEAQE